MYGTVRLKVFYDWFGKPCCNNSHTYVTVLRKKTVGTWLLAVCYCMYTMCTNENLINTVHNIGFYKFITYVGFVRCLLGWRIW